MACELAGGVPVRSDADVVARMIRAVRSGRVRFFEKLPLVRPLLGAIHVETAESGPPGADADEDDQSHWIEVRLADESDCGIPAQRCVIVAPDGQVHSRYTNSLGYIRIDRIAGGICEVSFPDLDASAWTPVAASG